MTDITNNVHDVCQFNYQTNTVQSYLFCSVTVISYDSIENLENLEFRKWQNAD